MNVNFLVPANHAAISGGNIYNDRLIRAIERSGNNVNLIAADDWQQCKIKLQPIENQLILADSLVLCKWAGELQPASYPGIVPFIHMPPEMMESCESTFAEKDKADAYWPEFRHMFVTSAYTKSFYMNKGLNENFITILEPSPSLVFKKEKYRNKPFKLINVANIIPGKNQLTLIKILSKLVEYHWELTIAGNLEADREYSQKVHEALQKTNLQSRILLAGAMDTQALTGLYTHADLLVSTSVFESFGMNIYDALCGGLPAVALAGGGIHHAMQYGSASVCSSEDEMERTLRKLFTTQNEYQKLISKGQQNPPEPVSWEQNAQVLMKKLEELS